MAESVEKLEERLRALETSFAEHRGNTGARWEASSQHDRKVDQELRELHVRLEGKFALVFKKLNALEVKTAVFAALAAAAGTVLTRLVF